MRERYKFFLELLRLRPQIVNLKAVWPAWPRREAVLPSERLYASHRRMKPRVENIISNSIGSVKCFIQCGVKIIKAWPPKASEHLVRQINQWRPAKTHIARIYKARRCARLRTNAAEIYAKISRHAYIVCAPVSFVPRGASAA